MGKLNTPRRLMPSVRVGAMRPISSGGTVVEPRVFQRSGTSCIFIVFQAMTKLGRGGRGGSHPAPYRHDLGAAIEKGFFDRRDHL
jgi:hypothetical protein